MGKQLIFDILQHKEVDRAAWVPFAGIHAGKLTGVSAKDVLTDENKLFEALMEVNKIYVPDGQPVLFDLQVEAEILGCDLMWSEDAPPTVSTHPLESEAIVPCKCKMPKETDGRLPMILRTMRRMKDAVGDTTALYGLVCGPFTLASHLRGTDIFMDMFDDPDYVIDLIKFCGEFIKVELDMYLDAGMDVIAVVDPLVSQISSDHFEEFLTESYTDVFNHIREKGAYSSFFVCGDATRNVEVMCKTKPDSISVDENIKLENAKVITDKYDVAIGGNIPLTTIMLHGSQQDNMKYVVDLIERTPNANKNLIIAPGCDMPYAIPIENTVGAGQAVREFEKVKEIVKDYSTTDYSSIAVEIPNYAKLSKPLVEAFTLDSSSCAACTYMMATANDLKAIYGDKIDVVEYKFTIKENIARCIKMGVKQLPSLYINGKLKFSSIIPSIDELKKELEKEF
ncbi:MAG: uroporphyrinogen decarboxylase family protein [Clostridia bacterium]